MVPYLRDGHAHHWGHVVESFRFESDEETYKVAQKVEMMNKLGWISMPLDRYYAHVREPCWDFAYNELKGQLYKGPKSPIYVPILLKSCLDPIPFPEQPVCEYCNACI